MTLTVDRIEDIYRRFIQGQPVAHAEWEAVFEAAKASLKIPYRDEWPWTPVASVADIIPKGQTCRIKSVNGVPFGDGYKTGVCQ